MQTHASFSLAISELPKQASRPNLMVGECANGNAVHVFTSSFKSMVKKSQKGIPCDFFADRECLSSPWQHFIKVS